MIDQVYELLWRNRGNVLTEELINGICFSLEKMSKPKTATPLYKDVAPEVYMGYTLAAEPFSLILPELKHLHYLHWEEIQQPGELNPNYEGYIERENAGLYCQFTLRKGPLLVGHLGAYLFENQHTRTLAAREDTYFIRKEHRKGLLAVRLIHFAERAMMQKGAQEFHASVKHKYPGAAKVLEFAGYIPVGTEFVKMLGEKSHVRT